MNSGYRGGYQQPIPGSYQNPNMNSFQANQMNMPQYGGFQNRGGMMRGGQMGMRGRGGMVPNNMMGLNIGGMLPNQMSNMNMGMPQINAGMMQGTTRHLFSVINPAMLANAEL